MNLSDLHRIDALMREVAAAIIMPRFGRLTQTEISAKTAIDDLVTVADLESEAALTAGLREMFAGCDVIGEETVTPDFDYAAPPLLFVIDPVDGTWPFARGLPVFGIIISVLRHGVPVAGLIHYPVTQDTLLVLRGAGVHHLRADGSGGQLPPLDGAARLETALLPLSQYDAETRRDLVFAFGDLPRIVTIQCSAYEYRMLVEGGADICISTGLKPWDHHAGQLMLAELGGYAATPDGRQWPDVTTGDRLISARNRATWDRAVAALT